MAKATQQMGRDLDPAIDWPSPKRDENPGRSDFAGWLAEDGGIPTFASAIDGWKQRRRDAETTGDELYSESKPKPRARRPGCSAEGSGAGWAEPTTLAALTATMETPASKIVRNRKKTGATQDPGPNDEIDRFTAAESSCALDLNSFADPIHIVGV